MQPEIGRLLHRAPRILGVVYAAFLAVFSLDVIQEGVTSRQMLGALAMHLLPTAVILASLSVAWRWGWAGGLTFLALGAWYLFTAWGRFPWSTCVAIAGPSFLLGLLFGLDWLCTRRPMEAGAGTREPAPNDVGQQTDLIT